MRLCLVLVSLCGLLTSCAALPDRAHGCDGRDKRPANPHGSVLSVTLGDVAERTGCRA